MKQCMTQMINNHAYNKIGNISIRCIVLFYIYKFYNFVILSGLLLFGVDNEVAFCRFL